MALPLKALHDVSPIKRVVVSSYQAASGAGAPAMAELYDQTQEFLDGKRGDELTTLTAPTKYAISTQFFTYNAAPVFPLAYNVTGSGDATGSNYVMLRDVASLLDFGVTYNATSTAINISTTSEYTPGL